MKKALILITTLFSFTAWAHSPEECSQYERYTDTSLEEMQKIVTQGQATIIDVNSPESFQKNHIPGAIHYGSQKDKIAQALPKDKDTLIVAYCGGPMCTAWQKAAQQACELGYTNIRHFSEGIKGWPQKGA